MHNLYNVKDRTDSRSLHACIFLDVDISPLPKILFAKEKLTNLFKLVENSNLDNLYSMTACRIVSKAFSVSKSTAAVDILLLKLSVTSFANLIN